MKKVLLLIVCLFLVVGAWIQVAEASNVLRVGVVGPFTGPAARTGEEFRGAVQMAFEQVDYKIGDYTVEIIWIDSQSDPERATRAYNDAVIRDRIDCGILNWHSSVAVALMDAAARNRVPHFFGFGATEVVLEKYHSDPERYSYWMGKTWPIPAKLCGAYVTALEDAIAEGLWEPRNRRAAIYGEDTDWGRSFGMALASQMEEVGWDVVAHEYFGLGETELYPLIAKLRDLDVSVVGGTVTSPPSFAAFIKQTREVGLRSLIIADGLGWVGEWYNMTGTSSNYVIDQIPQWTTPKAMEFAAEFEEKWGITPSTSAAGLAFDQTGFFIQIAQKAFELYGELNREILYKVGQEQLWAGELSYTDGIIMEEYKYTPETVPDPVVGDGYFIFPVLQYFDGVGKIVWPDVWKVADLAIPEYAK